MVLAAIGTVIVMFGLIGLWQIAQDVQSGVARVPSMTVWTKRDEAEVSRIEAPAKFWSALAGRGSLWLILVLVGVVMVGREVHL